MLADGLRGVLGSERVTRLEQLEANAEDRLEQATEQTTVRSLHDSTPNELHAPTEQQPLRQFAAGQRPQNVEPRDFFYVTAR